MSKFAEATAAKMAQAAERRKTFLELLISTGSVAEVCRLMHMNRKTYEQWRSKHPDFRDKVNRIRAEWTAKDAMEWKGDFVTFRKKYFGWDTYWHQSQIIHAIETAKPGRIVMVLVPPEHGKTTVLEDYINYKLGVDPNHRITYVHGSMDFAKKVLQRVSARMTDSELFPHYIAKFGPFVSEQFDRHGKPWTGTHLTVLKAKHDERDYSLQVRGWNSQVQGTRTDLLLLDDLQSMKTLALTEKIAQTIRQDFFSRPGKNGKIIIVGTRVGVGDIYEAFLADPGLGDLIDLVQLPALDKNGSPLCPELFSKEDLELKRRLVGEEAWWRNYQQAPTASGAQTFTAEMVDGAKLETLPACQPSSDPVVIGVDPALGGGNALVACSYTNTSLSIIDVQVDYGLSRTEDILDRIAEFANRYRPLDVIIETAAFQRGLARDDRLRAHASRFGFRIKEHETAGRKSDPVLGVASMAGSFMRREIFIPWGNQLAQGRMERLVAELLAWRPDIPTKLLKQDAVMALWFAWRFWMQRRQSMSYADDSWGFNALPWKPTKVKVT